jgi:Mn2+/Fe2+ NRAMP family transporter
VVLHSIGYINVGQISLERTRQTSAATCPRRFLASLGSGLITGASDDDPCGIGTYSQAGAQLGFGIGWTMLLTYPLIAGIQEISARIGRVTGHGAGNVCRTFRHRSSMSRS